MLIQYGFQPHAPINVNIRRDELKSTLNFVRDMHDKLHIDQDNIKTVEEKSHFYAN